MTMQTVQTAGASQAAVSAKGAAGAQAGPNARTKPEGSGEIFSNVLDSVGGAASQTNKAKEEPESENAAEGKEKEPEKEESLKNGETTLIPVLCSPIPDLHQTHAEPKEEPAAPQGIQTPAQIWSRRRTRVPRPRRQQSRQAKYHRKRRSRNRTRGRIQLVKAHIRRQKPPGGSRIPKSESTVPA
jgi:hypothetical protein